MSVPAVATRAGGGSDRALALFPAVTLLLFLGPVLIGVAATLLPAVGYLPALGGAGVTLAPWQRLWAEPAVPGAIRLTLGIGIAATAISLALALGIAAALQGTAWFAGVRRGLAPVLAVPHAALAIGLAFVIAPSGWLARLVSPGLSGWERPPDLALVNDPNGLALTLALVLKETPFLLLLVVAALGQARVGHRLGVARTLGYGPVTAWAKVVLPAVYRQIRLPLYAALAYALSVVDMALILGPRTPPTLPVLVVRWARDPDLDMLFLAAAAAVTQMVLVAGTVGAWRLAEIVVARASRHWLEAGGRGGSGVLARCLVLAAVVVGGVLTLGSLVVLGLWSLAFRWRFPDALPASWTLGNWQRAGGMIADPFHNTLVIGGLAAAVALVLTIGCLEHERSIGARARRAQWLLYLPLLVPEVAFLFGIQVLLVLMRLDGTWVAVVWAHLVFVLPYVFLTLSDPYRALDERYARSARMLGATPWRVMVAVRLPMLLRPILFAAAIGFAVSVALYLPTLFAGAGRLPTLTTEAVALAASGDRRVIGVYAFVQALLPLAGFAIAMALPAWLYRDRRGLRA